MTTELTIRKAFKLLFPSGGFWIEKWYGELGKTIDGFTGIFWRDFRNIEKIKNMLDPFKTDFVPELEKLFDLADTDMTTEERRARIDGRFQLLFENETRIQTMERILADSGFPVTIRTLGSNGTNESPFDFFPASGFGFWGAEEAIWGGEDFIYNNTSTLDDSELITNGGSIEYSDSGPGAIAELEGNSDYWGGYFIIEGAAGARVDIKIGQRDAFFELLYLLKPGKMHGILRANYI